jgi:putative acetyltransferase
MTEVNIRRFRESDAAATARVFYDSIHHATREFYDAAQRRAWAPEVPETEAWWARIAPQIAFVAERDGTLIGFMTLRTDGHLDLAFVAPDAVGQGVAKALYDALLAEATAAGMTRFTTEASLLARPFFLRQGWSVQREEAVERHGVILTRFRMALDLGNA